MMMSACSPFYYATHTHGWYIDRPDRYMQQTVAFDRCTAYGACNVRAQSSLRQQVDTASYTYYMRENIGRLSNRLPRMARP